MLDGRKAENIRGSSYDFAFSGLIKCGHCGCAMVGEIKKKKYVYYHCSGFKGKCDEPYTREEVLEEQFAELLRQLRIDDDVFDWMRRALKESWSAKKRDQEEAIARLEKEVSRLTNRLETLYVDRVDGRVSEAFYDRTHRQWSDEQKRCLAEIANHRHADFEYMDQGIDLLELANNAHRLFEKQSPGEKARLLNYVLSNSVWKHGELHAEFRQPFDMLAETAAIAARNEASEKGGIGRFEKWLPGPDSNQRPSG